MHKRESDECPHGKDKPSSRARVGPGCLSSSTAKAQASAMASQWPENGLDENTTITQEVARNSEALTADSSLLPRPKRAPLI